MDFMTIHLFVTEWNHKQRVDIVDNNFIACRLQRHSTALRNAMVIVCPIGLRSRNVTRGMFVLKALENSVLCFEVGVVTISEHKNVRF